MQIVYARCAGLDVHKKTVVVCARLVSTDGTLTTHLRTFGTTTAELLNLVTWLLALEVTHIGVWQRFKHPTAIEHNVNELRRYC